jgi:hypothetical protein
MGCHTVAFSTAGLHADEAETFLCERRFSVDTYLPAVEYVDECSCHKNQACCLLLMTFHPQYLH